MIIRAEDKNPLFDAIKRDIFNKRTNKLIIVTGGTQKGKSRLTITMGTKLSTRFDISKHVAVIDPAWFMRVLNQEGLQRGDPVIYDDAGLGINSQDFYEFQVKTLSRIFHIIGNLGLPILISTPNLKFIAAQVRAVCTDRIVVKGIDWRRNKIKFKYYSDIKYDENTGKEYKSLPTVVYPNGKKRKVRMWTTEMASTEVLSQFYALESPKKTEYRQESLMEIEKDQLLQVELKKTQGQKIKEIVDQVIAKPGGYVRERHGRRYIDAALIETDFDIGGRVSLKVKKAAERALGLDDTPLASGPLDEEKAA